MTRTVLTVGMALVAIVALLPANAAAGSVQAGADEDPTLVTAETVTLDGRTYGLELVRYANGTYELTLDTGQSTYKANCENILDCVEDVVWIVVDLVLDVAGEVGDIIGHIKDAVCGDRCPIVQKPVVRYAVM